MLPPDPEQGNFAPQPGRPEPLAPGLRRLLAPNPSPMTFRGTNTYLLGERRTVVIDPGPDDLRHLQAILASTESARVEAILVTHAHRDHAGLAPRLTATTGAPVFAFGPADAGRSVAMQRLAATGEIGGGEGVMASFKPDRDLPDDALVETDTGPVRAMWTPGHMGHHLCFAWADAVFTGDLVMGWASTLISPPDGDVDDYFASCAKLKALSPARLYPGHGAPVLTPVARIDALVNHRRAREVQIRDALAEAPARASELADRLYHLSDPILREAATRNVLAHLVALHARGEITVAGTFGASARFGPPPVA